MKKTILTLCALSLFLPTLAFAHERQIFKIGDTYYLFVVGNQNEPVAVDDKTGLDLRIQRVITSTADAGTPIEGLEKSLKLEIQADGQKRIQDILPAYRQPGVYYSPFYPTKATAFTHRIMGSLEGNTIDLSFTCQPGEHSMMVMNDDVSTKEMGNGVTQVFQSGMFGCPKPKAELGFPVPSTAIADIVDDVQNQGTFLAKVSREFGFVEIALGFLAVLLAVTLRKRA